MKHCPDAADPRDSRRHDAHLTRRQCLDLLEARQVPPHIRAHSEVVAGLAVRIAADLCRHGGPCLDQGLLEAAGLLHDIAKADCLDKHLLNHAEEGARLLRSRGFPQGAALVERHVYVTADDCRRTPGEIQVLCYADKRVLHDRIVSLDERYDDLVHRYGNSPARASVIETNRILARELEEIIFRHLPYAAASLSDARD